MGIFCLILMLPGTAESINLWAWRLLQSKVATAMKTSLNDFVFTNPAVNLAMINHSIAGSLSIKEVAGSGLLIITLFCPSTKLSLSLLDLSH